MTLSRPTSDLPLLAPWSGPRGGSPPFAKVSVEDFSPAILAAIEANRKEIADIAGDPAPPTFANTIAALEDSGRALSRATAIYGGFTSAIRDHSSKA